MLYYNMPKHDSVVLFDFFQEKCLKMRQVLKPPACFFLLFFFLFWGTSLVCVLLEHHTTERNYAHAHFSISVPTGDHPFAAHNSAAHGGDGAVNHAWASSGLVTIHSGHVGSMDSVSAQPLIVPESTMPSPDLWEFPVSQPISAPSEVLQPPPDRPPAFPV